jgi:hypothetical protein
VGDKESSVTKEKSSTFAKVELFEFPMNLRGFL